MAGRAAAVGAGRAAAIRAGRVAAVGAGRAAVRSVGMVTAGSRPPPDFLLIGAKRGGTTSLYFHLLRHPQVVPLFPRPDHLPKATFTKGIHYFDANAHRGPRWYSSHLPSRRVRQGAEDRIGLPVVTGEASPYYLFHPLAPGRAAQLLPDVRLLALLRDPVERAFSHWKERRRAGAEPLGFADALAAEDDRLGVEEELLQSGALRASYAHEQQSYARQSEYVTSLQRWLGHYPAERLLVLVTEDYVADSAGVLAQCADFLGLRPADLPGAERRNRTAAAQLPAGVRRRLEERFAPCNDRLSGLLGRPLPWA